MADGADPERLYAAALRELVGALDAREVSRRLLLGALRLAQARSGEVVLRGADGAEEVTARRVTRAERDASVTWKLALRAQGRVLGELRIAGARPRSPARRRAVGQLAGAGALALEAARAHEAVLRRAELDPLTGLANHGRLWAALDYETKRAERYGGTVSIVMLDVDGFKKFNDRHGHLAGDEALQRTAALVRARSRATDTAARYGGDEFALVLPQTPRAGAIAVAEKIRLSVEELRVCDETVSLSAGVATAPDDGRTATEIVRAADKRLYAAKSAGGNRVATES